MKQIKSADRWLGILFAVIGGLGFTGAMLLRRGFGVPQDQDPFWYVVGAVLVAAVGMAGLVWVGSRGVDVETPPEVYHD
jgi:drug/metabolite transporter (DMT)-like permease